MPGRALSDSWQLNWYRKYLVSSAPGSSVSSIRKLWQRLESAIHPDDITVLSSHQHTFNLDFPPPAFVGDVDNAPIVILMANGGYDSARTPKEFRDQSDVEEHLQYLRGERQNFPKNLSEYYGYGGMYDLVRANKAVVVNAVAYRSRKITDEPQNQRVAKLLPSVMAHKRWLREEVLPAAQNGDRLLVAHRCGLWKFPKREAKELRNVYHSSNPISPHISGELLEKVMTWAINK